MPEKIPHKKIASGLKEMVRIDQKMRLQNTTSDTAWDPEIDKVNTRRIKEIVAEIGWPTVSKVGEEGMKNAWLIVQHSPDFKFQETCLDLMKNEPETEVSKKTIAYLEDRVRMHQNRPQLYGTQFRSINGKFGLYEVEDPDNLDVRRLEAGMEPIAEYTQKINSDYGIKND